MKVAVIGAAGHMGSWFTRYFREKGHEVLVSDVRGSEAKKVAEDLGARFARSNGIAASRADAVLVSVPIAKTPDVLAEVSPFMEEDAILMEIASVKKGAYTALRTIASKRAIRPLSVHPLFGPGARTMAGKRVAIVPILEAARELGLARALLPEAELVRVDFDEHDRAMAIVVSLTHFANLLFSSAISGEDVGRLRGLAGTTFALQLNLAEGILHDEPELAASLQFDSPYALRYIKMFLEKGEALAKMVSRGQRGRYHALYADVKRALSRDLAFDEAYKAMYDLFEAMVKS